MKNYAFIFILMSMFAFNPTFAQTQAGAHLGFNVDNNHFLAGVNARLPLSRQINGASLTFNPSLEYNFGGYGILNADILYGLRPHRTQPYAGLGLGLAFNDGRNSLGLNLKGGMVFKPTSRNLKPFAELGLTIDDGSILVFRGGVIKNL
jgi:hypothetical protein